MSHVVVPTTVRRCFHRRKGENSYFRPSEVLTSDRALSLRHARRTGKDIHGGTGKDLRRFWGLIGAKSSGRSGKAAPVASTLRFEGSCVAPREETDAFYSTSNKGVESRTWEQDQRRNMEACLLVALESGLITEAEYQERIG